MSLKVSKFYLHSSPLRGTMKLLLCELADYANDQGVAMPGIERLACDINYSERWTQKILAKLVENGELVINYQCGLQTGHGCTNQFYLVAYRSSIGVNTEDTPRSEHCVHSNYQGNDQKCKTKDTSPLSGDEELHTRTGAKPDDNSDPSPSLNFKDRQKEKASAKQNNSVPESENVKNSKSPDSPQPDAVGTKEDVPPLVNDFTKPNPYRMGTKEWGEWNTAKMRQMYDRRLEIARKKQDRERGTPVDEDGNELASQRNPRTPAEVWFLKWLRNEGYNVSLHGLNADARRKFEQRVAVQMQPKIKYRPSIPELYAQQGAVFEEWLSYTLKGWKNALNGKKSKVTNAIAYIHNQYLTYDEWAKANNTEWWNQPEIEEKEMS